MPVVLAAREAENHRVASRGSGKRVVVVSSAMWRILPQYCLFAGARLRPRRKHRSYSSRERALGTRVASGVSMREIQARKRTMVEGLVQTHLNSSPPAGANS